jgi:hypothetical protein
MTFFYVQLTQCQPQQKYAVSLQQPSILNYTGTQQVMHIYCTNQAALFQHQ